ncbi:MAG: hypothetical protein ACI8UO_005113 [Verrucomicrobiales bacterium]|jgi:hypothetical protein
MMMTTNTSTRRNFLGFSSLAAAGLASGANHTSPYAVRSTHLPARAKRVIFLCMKGGPSHVDMFDYKPKLQADDGKPWNGSKHLSMLGSLWKFSQHGQGGLWFSELLPHLAEVADEICMLNGMHTDVPEHAGALDFLHTGSFQFIRPSMGAWTLYGLGATNENLPGFIAINPPTVLGGSKYYGSSFLPAAYQGTPIGGNNLSMAKVEVSNLSNARLNREEQRNNLDLLQTMNQQLLAERGRNSPEVEGVMESFELGYRMQSALPEAMNLSGESDETKQLYGMGGGPSADFGHQCLLARRFIESGVRFVQLTMDGWDLHGALGNGMNQRCQGIDKPVAGLITDLRRRGLLDETLIVWGGEFGRTPYDASRDGRGHNATGFSMFLAGAGVKRGFRHGETDEYGRMAVDGQVHIHDLHATMLHLLGLDHKRLTYPWAGRNFRLTDVHGRVVHEILA